MKPPILALAVLVATSAGAAAQDRGSVTLIEYPVDRLLESTSFKTVGGAREIDGVRLYFGKEAPSALVASLGGVQSDLAPIKDPPPGGRMNYGATQCRQAFTAAVAHLAAQAKAKGANIVTGVLSDSTPGVSGDFGRYICRRYRRASDGHLDTSYNVMLTGVAGQVGR